MRWIATPEKEPFHGGILDPVCTSGGMFVQSARFVAGRFLHRPHGDQLVVETRGDELRPDWICP